MKTLAYFDCPTGIAGDMCLGALVHAGVPLTYLSQQLARLGIQNEFNLQAESVLRNQQ
ncbi:MAG: nickel insertion protein, partial [Cyanobacteria bacterium J06560_2]